MIRRFLQLWLLLLSLHSILLGAAIYLITDLLVGLQGLDLSGSLFYPRQSGVFLIILGVGYGLAAIDPEGRQALVCLAIFSKALAVLFLFSEVLLFGAPSLIITAGVVDAVEGGVLVILSLIFYGERRGRQ